MPATLTTFELLATLFSYPDAQMVEALTACDAGGEASDPGVAESLREFARTLPSRDLADLEELYVQTFDMNPARALELGWHLFGETYERGSFLVEVRGLLRSHGVEETSELPDHLAHVMQLLSRLEPAAAAAFARKSLLPGIAKLRAGFKDETQPYCHLIIALERAVQAAYGEPKGV